MLSAIFTGLIGGLVAGSYGNSLVYRMPLRMKEEWRQAAQEVLELPVDVPSSKLKDRRSHCPHCKARIPWYRNIPVVSWLALRGKCSDCAAPIPLRYLLLELAGAGIGAGSAALYGMTLPALLLATAGLLLLWASAVDIEHQLLPDALVFPVLWLGLILSVLHVTLSTSAAVWGALIGYGLLALPALAFRLLRGVDGVGGGDAKLLMATGTFLGPQATIMALLIGCVLGLIAHVAGMPENKGAREAPKPFGQWLALGSALVFVANQMHLVPW